MVIVLLLLIASLLVPDAVSLTAQQPSTPASAVEDVVLEPTVPPTEVPTEAPVPTIVPTPIPTEIPTITPTQIPTALPTSAPTAVPTPTPRPSSGITSIEPGTGEITGCTQSGSDTLPQGGTVTATCTFQRFGSHPADFTITAPTSTVSGAAAGWQVQLTFGSVGTGWVSTQTTYRAPADATSFTVSLRAPGTGGVPSATVTSRVDVQSCNPGGNCNTGTTMIGARLATANLGRVTMSCSPASPLPIVRTQLGTVTCTIRIPADFGATLVALRSFTIPAAPSGWGITTSPSGTTGANGSITVSPNQSLAAGQSWSFTLTLAPGCTAISPVSWSITSRIAEVRGGVAGAEVAGPSVTYGANATNGASSISASFTTATLSLSAPFSLDDRTMSGTLRYRAAGAGCTGWSVSVRAQPFTYSGSSPGSPIPVNNLVLTNAGVPSLINGNGTGVASTFATGGLGTTRKVLNAQPGAGNGTYEQALTVSLTVPGGTNIGTYRSTITITTAVAP